MLALRQIAFFALALAVLAGADSNAQTPRDSKLRADEAARSSEAQLNAVVTRYRLELNKHQRTLFDISQQQWVAYRKAACEFQASGVEGGTMYPMVYAYCLDKYAQARLVTVTALLKCTEGDLACPESRHGT